jgi:hypothetical protein
MLSSWSPHYTKIVLSGFDREHLYYLIYDLFIEPANRKLTKKLCEVIDDFSLVNFTTLDIQVCA